MTHPHRRSVGLAGLLLAVLAADAYAQIGAPLPLKVEDEIIVTDSAGTRTAGRISAITGESLTIQSPDGLWNGTLIGIGAGVAAEVAGIATSHGGVSGPEVIGRLVVGSAFGAAAGSLVDRAITRTRPRTFSMPTVVEIRRHDSRLNGLFAGLGIGAGVGFTGLAVALNARSCRGVSCDFWYYGASWMAPLAGSVAGILIDHFHGNEVVYRRTVRP